MDHASLIVQEVSENSTGQTLHFKLRGRGFELPQREIRKPLFILLQGKKKKERKAKLRLSPIDRRNEYFRASPYIQQTY